MMLWPLRSLDLLVAYVRLRPTVAFPLVAVMQIGLFCAAVSRGLDYIAPPPVPSTAITAVEGVMPIEVWGYLFITFGLAGLIGLHCARTPLAAMGHGWLACIYSTFGVGAIAVIVWDGPIADWRTGVGWVLVQGVSHWCLANASWDEWREVRFGAFVAG